MSGTFANLPVARGQPPNSGRGCLLDTIGESAELAPVPSSEHALAVFDLMGAGEALKAGTQVVVLSTIQVARTQKAKSHERTASNSAFFTKDHKSRCLDEMRY